MEPIFKIKTLLKAKAITFVIYTPCGRKFTSPPYPHVGKFKDFGEGFADLTEFKTTINGIETTFPESLFTNSVRVKKISRLPYIFSLPRLWIHSWFRIGAVTNV